MREAALISHYYPSVGHPLDLPMDEWNALSYELKYIIPMSTGHLSQERSNEMSGDTIGWNGSWVQ